MAAPAIVIPEDAPNTTLTREQLDTMTEDSYEAGWNQLGEMVQRLEASLMGEAYRGDVGSLRADIEEQGNLSVARRRLRQILGKLTPSGQEGSGKIGWKLRKAPRRDLYWVVSKEDGRHHSKEPLPLERAKAQMRALYAAKGRDLKGRGTLDERRYKQLVEAIPTKDEYESTWQKRAVAYRDKPYDQFRQEQMDAARQRATVAGPGDAATPMRCPAAQKYDPEKEYGLDDQICMEVADASVPGGIKLSYGPVRSFLPEGADPDPVEFCRVGKNSLGNMKRSECARLRAEAEQQFLANEPEYQKVFRKINEGLTAIADAGVDVAGTLLPGVGKYAAEAYKTFAPPGSKFYQSGTVAEKALRRLEGDRGEMTGGRVRAMPVPPAGITPAELSEIQARGRAVLAELQQDNRDNTLNTWDYYWTRATWPYDGDRVRYATEYLHWLIPENPMPGETVMTARGGGKRPRRADHLARQVYGLAYSYLEDGDELPTADEAFGHPIPGYGPSELSYMKALYSRLVRRLQGGVSVSAPQPPAVPAGMSNQRASELEEDARGVFSDYTDGDITLQEARDDIEHFFFQNEDERVYVRAYFEYLVASAAHAGAGKPAVIRMPRKKFLAEHKRLIHVLTKGTPAERKAEAADQAAEVKGGGPKELAKYIAAKPFSDLSLARQIGMDKAMQIVKLRDKAERAEYRGKDPVERLLDTGRPRRVGSGTDAKFLAAARKKAKEAGLAWRTLRASSKPGKKLQITAPNGRTVHFGAAGMGDFIHYTLAKDPTAEEHRRRYRARATKIRGNWKADPYSPNSLALAVLW